MKQYTTPDQTAKLIELGFEKPKTIVDKYYDFDAEAYKEVNHYSIGELIEMLPTIIRREWCEYDLTISLDCVLYKAEGYLDLYWATRNDELIDNLFDMVSQLKEEGVI